LFATWLLLTSLQRYSWPPMTLNYLLLNLNSINQTLLSVLYFSTNDCVYTDLVLSGCVAILKIFTEVYCMILV